MQVGLTLQFPHNQRQVPVRIFVPQPERRPRTVANFVYMCTGELPPPDMLDALRIPRTEVAYQSSEEARQAGLKPFAETAVVRVEKQVMMEIGGSTSKSIFGGFIPDERLDARTTAGPAAVPAPLSSSSSSGVSIAASLTLLKAGTVLCGNIGMPDSHASRYYILLADVKEKGRESYACYTPLGMVTSGLEQLLTFTSNVPVQPRSLEPLKKVVLTATQLEFNYQPLLLSLRGHGDGNGGGGGGSGALAAPPLSAARGRRGMGQVERISGRVRGRDEDDDDDESGESNRRTHADDEKQGDMHGFFQFTARFPVGGGGGRSRKGGAGPGPGPAAKRLRTENAVVAVDEDGFPILRNTALQPSSDDDGNEDGPGEQKERQFNYFNAQEAAFINDIDVIKERQQARTYKRMNRLAKHRSSPSSSSTGKYGTVSSRTIRERALKSQESRLGSGRRGKKGSSKRTLHPSSTTTTTSGGSGSTAKRRDVKKRY